MIDATVASDGTTFAGTFVFLFLGVPVQLSVTGNRCGNGLLLCAIDDALREAIEQALRDYQRAGLRRIAHAGAVGFAFAAPSSGTLEVHISTVPTGSVIVIAEGRSMVESPARVVAELGLSRRARRLLRRRRILEFRVGATFTAQGGAVTEADSAIIVRKGVPEG